jgi:sporulation protein YlmC with PRC-barrel domain
MSEQFQLDLLVGRRVYDSEGWKLGRADEIRLVWEGERYEVEGLLIGVNGLAERLGVAGPLERLEKRLRIRSWHVEDHIVYWEQIASVEEKAIRLKVRREEVEATRSEG